MFSNQKNHLTKNKNNVSSLFERGRYPMDGRFYISHENPPPSAPPFSKGGT